MIRKLFVLVGVSGLSLTTYIPPAQAASYKVTVRMVVTGYSGLTGWNTQAEAVESCADGINKYRIAQGEAVKVVNESNKIVGLGKLTIVQASQPDSESDWVCVYSGTFKVSSAKFYTISVGTHGGPDYSFAELKRKKWRITLFL